MHVLQNKQISLFFHETYATYSYAKAHANFLAVLQEIDLDNPPIKIKLFVHIRISCIYPILSAGSRIFQTVMIFV